MKLFSGIFAGAALAAIASVASATTPSPVAVAHTAAATRAEPDSARIAAALASANQLAKDGRVREAIRTLQSVVSEQQHAGDYPREALRRLANLQYGTGEALASARTLDELARASQEFGDPETQLRALFDAALVYQELKINDRAPERVRQINSLLKSPAIDASVRADIAARMVRG